MGQFLHITIIIYLCAKLSGNWPEWKIENILHIIYYEKKHFAFKWTGMFTFSYRFMR